MKTTMTKYTSPSTPSVQHDLTNFVVEAILMNRHGALSEAAWRKGQPFAKEWGTLLIKVRRVSKLGVDTQQLAWFVQFYKITDLDYKEFGLLRWKIKQYFKWVNIDRFVAFYTQLQKILTEGSSDYVDATQGYKTKTESSNRKKTLTEILEELKNGRSDD